MQISIDVDNQEEATLIQAGLQLPEVRAFVKVCGALSALPSDRSRRRVVAYVMDRMDESRAELARDAVVMRDDRGTADDQAGHDDDR